MKQKNYVGLFVFFFVIGLLWGKFFYYNEENRQALFTSDTMILLAEDGFMPSDVLESFSLENNSPLQIVTYKSKADLLSKLKNGQFDLVAFKSFYAQDVMPFLSKISYKEIKNKESISIDFKNLKYDPENKHSVPLFWGIERSDKIEKSVLWIESLGIAKKSSLKDKAHGFIDYIMQLDVTMEVIRHKKVASTNKNIEKENVESKLKPSYLRKISIRDLAFAERASF